MKNSIDYRDLQLHYLELDEYICENIYPINNIVFTEKINWLKGVAIAAGAIGLGFLLKWIANRYNINLAKILSIQGQQHQNTQIAAKIVQYNNNLDNLSEEEKANKAAEIVIQYLLSSNALNDSLKSSIKSLNAEDLKNILITIEREKSYCDQTKIRLEQFEEKLNAKASEIVSQKYALSKKDEDLAKRSTELDAKTADIEAREKKIGENEKKLRQDLDTQYKDYYNKQIADVKQEYETKNANREAEHQQKINELDELKKNAETIISQQQNEIDNKMNYLDSQKKELDKEKELINSQKKEIENKNQELQQRKQSLDEYDSNLSSVRDELEKREKTANLKDDELKGKEQSLKDEDQRLKVKQAAARADKNLIEKGSKYDTAIKQINKLTKDLDETESQLTASHQCLMLSNGIIEKIGKELNLTIEQIKENPDLVINKIKQADFSNATTKIKESQQKEKTIIERINRFEMIKQQNTPRSPLISNIEPNSKKIDIDSIIVVPKSKINPSAIDECQLLTILNKLVRNATIFVTNLQIESNSEEFKKLAQENLKSNQNLESFNKELNTNMKIIFNNINTYLYALEEKYINDNKIKPSQGSPKMNYSNYFDNINFLNKFNHLNKLSNLTESESYIYFINDQFKELPNSNNEKINSDLANLIKNVNTNLNDFITKIKKNTTKSTLLTYLDYVINKSILDDYLK